MLYPYNNLEQYYNSVSGSPAKVKRLVKADPSLFKNTQTLRGGRDLKLFKLACLKPEQMLYEDANLCIGVKSYLYMQKGLFLKMELYFANKSGSLISDLKFQLFGHTNVQVWSNTNNFSEFIQPEETIHQKVMFSFNSVPYDVVGYHFEYK